MKAARLGFVIRRAAWDKRRIVRFAWLDYATQPAISHDDTRGDYVQMLMFFGPIDQPPETITPWRCLYRDIVADDWITLSTISSPMRLPEIPAVPWPGESEQA